MGFVAVPECPQCHQYINSQAIACPYCKLALKAYGHPGITLHRATGVDALCKSCAYEADDSCTLPQRPHARECTLYSDRDRPVSLKPQPSNSRQSFKSWVRQNGYWIILLGLVLLSALIVLS